MKQNEKLKCKTRTAVWLEEEKVEKQWRGEKVGGKGGGAGRGGGTEPGVGRAGAREGGAKEEVVVRRQPAGVEGAEWPGGGGAEEGGASGMMVAEEGWDGGPEPSVGRAERGGEMGGRGDRW